MIQKLLNFIARTAQYHRVHPLSWPVFRSVIDEINSRRAIRNILPLLPLTRNSGGPNCNQLWLLLRDVPLLHLNIKNFGYALAQQLTPALAANEPPATPGYWNLVSKACTQADVESDWFAYWCAELKVSPLYHRKLWEFAFLLQVLHEGGALRTGACGIGFGCGEEPLASYFSHRGIDALITDLEPAEVAGRGWQETGQHTTSKEAAFYPQLTGREEFERHVSHQFADMNALPSIDQRFDFCWSVCALEHLGSIQAGLDFVVNSLTFLRPGGIAIHTTEFNYLRDDETVDYWATVLFQKKHFLELQARLAALGHEMLNPDFDIGSGALDRFIDLPPYNTEASTHNNGAPWAALGPAPHLKLSVDGFASTCFGIVVRKGNA